MSTSVQQKRDTAASVARLDVEVKFAASGEGTFTGYASVFDHIDLGGDLIVKGAFAATLGEWKGRGKLPKMLLQHAGGMFGAASDVIPIGQWTAMSEDSKGLAVEGRLIALDTDRGKSVYAAMREGELDGLSIGYRVKEFSLGTKPGEPFRTIKRLDLLEVSVVLFGMNDRALIDSVKSIGTAREFEALLRQAGFSNAQAKKLTAGGWPALSPDTHEADLSDLAAEIRASAAAISRKD